MWTPAFWIALLASLAGCFFASCHMAAQTFSRARLAEVFAATGRGDRLERFLERIDDLLLMTGVLRAALNLAVLLAVLFLVETHAAHWPPAVQYLVAFLISAAAISVFTVGLPFSISRHAPERLLAASSGVLGGSRRLLAPLVWSLRALDPVVRRLAGVRAGKPDEEQVSAEVLSVVQEHEEAGSVDPVQAQMIEAVFDLPSTTAGEIMTPRTEIQAIPVTARLPEVKEALLHAGHSRVPVYEGTIDNIVGVLYAKDLLDYLVSDRPFDLRQVMRQALMVPETKPVRQLLAEFKARKVHIAIVLDEYGGTAGLVTIEDIVEELFGEIQDEYEPGAHTPAIRRIDDRTAEADARVRVPDLNAELALGLPEDGDYDTLGGFVSSTLGHIPGVGEKFEFDGCRFVVVDAERTRVKRVRIERLTPAEAKESEGEVEAS